MFGEETLEQIWRTFTNREAADPVSMFVDLVNSQSWVGQLIAGIIVFAIAVYALVMVLQVTIGVFDLGRKLWKRGGWVTAVTVLLAIVLAATGSRMVVNYVRGNSLPVPSVPEVAAVLGEDQVLQWLLPEGRAGSSVRFEVQWSQERGFPPGDRTNLATVDDTVMPLVATENQSLWWRVRAVEGDASARYRKVGHWSKPVRIDQYTSAWNRVRDSRILRVAMERSYGRSKYRFYSGVGRTSPDGVGGKLERRGVEIDLAHLIADQLCRSMFFPKAKAAADGKPAKPVICLPSRQQDYEKKRDATDCKKNVCERIEAKFNSTGWPDVMSEVGRGKYDMAISTITYFPERENEHNILFTRENYQDTSHALVYKNKSVPLNDDGSPIIAGKVIAVQRKTTSHFCLRYRNGERQGADGSWKPGPAGDEFSLHVAGRAVVAFQTIMRGRGRYQFVMTDTAFAEGWKTHYGDKVGFFETPENYFGDDAPAYCSRQQYRIAVRAAEFDLRDAADNVLLKARTSGRLAEIKARAEKDFDAFIKKRSANNQVASKN